MLIFILSLVFVIICFEIIRRNNNQVGTIAGLLFVAIIISAFAMHISTYSTANAEVLEQIAEARREKERTSACVRASKHYIRCIKDQNNSSKSCKKFKKSDEWYFDEYGRDILFDCLPLASGQE